MAFPFPQVYAKSSQSETWDLGLYNYGGWRVFDCGPVVAVNRLDFMFAGAETGIGFINFSRTRIPWQPSFNSNSIVHGGNIPFDSFCVIRQNFTRIAAPVGCTDPDAPFSGPFIEFNGTDGVNDGSARFGMVSSFWLPSRSILQHAFYTLDGGGLPTKIQVVCLGALGSNTCWAVNIKNAAYEIVGTMGGNPSLGVPAIGNYTTLPLGDLSGSTDLNGGCFYVLPGPNPSGVEMSVTAS